MPVTWGLFRVLHVHSLTWLSGHLTEKLPGCSPLPECSHRSSGYLDLVEAQAMGSGCTWVLASSLHPGALRLQKASTRGHLLQALVTQTPRRPRVSVSSRPTPHLPAPLLLLLQVSGEVLGQLPLLSLLHLALPGSAQGLVLDHLGEPGWRQQTFVGSMGHPPCTQPPGVPTPRPGQALVT